MRQFILLGILPSLPLAAQFDQRTTIDSDELEMQGSEERNYFYFRGNVVVRGIDLEITCNELTVTAQRGGDASATIGEVGAIERIVARGDVEIDQAGREAYAGRVEVDPRAGTITFLENPVIVQGEIRATAHGFVFHSHDKRLEALTAPADVQGRQRSRISLPALPAVTFDLDEEDITVDERIRLQRAAEEGAAGAEDAGPTEGPAEPEEAEAAREGESGQ